MNGFLDHLPVFIFIYFCILFVGINTVLCRTLEVWQGLQSCLEIVLLRKLQPGSSQKIVVTICLFDLHSFSSHFIISVVKMERGENRSWIMQAQFLNSFLHISDISKKQKRPEKSGGPLGNAVSTRGFLPWQLICVVPLSSKANQIAIGIQHSLNCTNSKHLL